MFLFCGSMVGHQSSPTNLGHTRTPTLLSDSLPGKHIWTTSSLTCTANMAGPILEAHHGWRYACLALLARRADVRVCVLSCPPCRASQRVGAHILCRSSFGLLTACVFAFFCRTLETHFCGYCVRLFLFLTCTHARTHAAISTLCGAVLRRIQL